MENTFKRIIAEILQNENIYLYWKGRVALYALLKAMGVKEGDEVIIPAYTCVVVPNAIIYLGAKPVYVDIAAETYNTNPQNIRKSITDKTKAIVVQNTYGLSTDIEEIISIAKEYKLYTIEDCTHGFGGYYCDKPNGSFCDAAFYSTQWNKPFSTGIGGFAMVNNSGLLNNLNEVNKLLIQPTLQERLSIKIQLIAKSYLVNRYTYWSALKFYRYLTSRNIVLGSSSGSEINSIKMPKSFFKAMSSTQEKEGVKALPKLSKVMARRKKTANEYTAFLSNHKKRNVKPELNDNHAFLKYPLHVKDRSKFFELAEKSEIMLGDWFTSPLHPVEENLDQWGFDKSKYPVAVQCAESIVNLPTDLNEKELSLVLSFMSRYLDNIL